MSLVRVLPGWGRGLSFLEVLQLLHGESARSHQGIIHPVLQVRTLRLRVAVSVRVKIGTQACVTPDLQAASGAPVLQLQ